MAVMNERAWYEAWAVFAGEQPGTFRVVGRPFDVILGRASTLVEAVVIARSNTAAQRLGALVEFVCGSGDLLVMTIDMTSMAETTHMPPVDGE